MHRRVFPPLAAAIALATAVAAPVDADEPGDDARAIAVKVTTAGAAMFDKRDAKGLAETYTDDARFDFITKNADSGEPKVETHQGRADVEAFYRDVFKDCRQPHARNTVEYARLVGPDLLVIAGVFVPDTEADNPVKLPFTQVRVKKGDAWRVVTLQVVLGGLK